jgi:tryptophan halogenase
MMREFDRMAVVGGGTSGLVAALLMKARYPQLELDIIASEAQGIIGVGEGSTEHWAHFMRLVGITHEDMVRHCGATFKYGIRFKGWQTQGDYTHSISENYKIDGAWIYPDLIAQGAQPDDLVSAYVLNSQHRAPWGDCAPMHFDTQLLNQYLRELCQQRGICIINADVQGYTANTEGGIQSLTTDLGPAHYGFYIDATGFNRLLVGSYLAQPWEDDAHLPMDSAWAWQTAVDHEIPSYTQANAHSTGWSWKIPTQTHWGYGHVFTSQYTSAEQALADIHEQHPNVKPRLLKFHAGRLTRSWVANVAAVGIASSFLEPLEATTIGMSIQQSLALTELIRPWIQGSSSDLVYNEFSEGVYTNARDLVRCHYVTDRRDSEFWRAINSQTLPQSLMTKLAQWQTRPPEDADFPPGVLFRAANWQQVLHGQRLSRPWQITNRQAQQHLKELNDSIATTHWVSHRTAIQTILA